MKSREKKLLITLGIVAVVSIPLLPIWGNESDSVVSGAGETGGNTISRLDRSAQDLPSLKLDQLNAEKEEFSGSRRNLFAFNVGTADVEEQDEEENEVQPEVADNVADEESGNRTRKLAGYIYLGFHQTDGTRTAVFEWRGRPFLGTVGSIINDTFEIKDIRTRYALIHVINGDFEQRLSLGAPVTRPSGGVK